MTIEVYNEYRAYLKNSGMTKNEVPFADFKATIAAEQEDNVLAQALEDMLDTDDLELVEESTLELGEFPNEDLEETQDAPVEVVSVEQDITPVVVVESPKPAVSGKKRGRKGTAVKDAQAAFHANYSKLTSGEMNRKDMIALMVSHGISESTAIVQYAIQKKVAEQN